MIGGDSLGVSHRPSPPLSTDQYEARVRPMRGPMWAPVDEAPASVRSITFRPA